ncbi:MAG: aspartate kinase [Planctomycetes bacterium]|nr:aspartate kinase [Planctomycetota bacterium]
MKFGGTSVADAPRIRTVVRLARERLDRRPVVVVSALAGVTNLLIDLAHRALKGATGVQEIRDRHRAVLEDLGLPPDLVAEEVDDLRSLLKGITLVGELTPRSLDCIMSFGERLSSKVVAAAFRAEGLEARACNAYDIGLVTDDRFGSANPLESCYEGLGRNLAKVEGIPVVTGFIGRDRRGNITTLGRGGSDYSASIVGRAVGAEEIQIWTDVDGVMSADPKLCPKARSLEVLSFAEASELAYYGAKVVHPSTMIPAIVAQIPVRVLNTYRPEHPGTVILAKAPPARGGVKSIACRSRLSLITVTSTRMLMQTGFMARIFEVLGRHEVVIDMVATSEVTVSLTTDTRRDLEPALAELREIAEVEVEKNHAIVCLVGEGIRATGGTLASVFETLREARIRPRMVSFAASNVNVSILVPERSVARAVKTLHARFFE